MLFRPQTRNMPAKNGNKKGKQGKRKGASRASVPATIRPMLQVMRVYMGYVGTGAIAEASAGTGAIYQYRLNSVYDPDYTSTGTTAQGFYHYTGFYQQFRVLRVRAITRFWNGNNNFCTVGLIPSGNTVVTSNYALLQNQPYARSKNLTGNAGGTHSSHEFDDTFDLAKVFGISKREFADSDFAHFDGANPVKTLYLTLFLSGASATVCSVGFSCRLVYDVEVSRPIANIVN